MVDHHRRHGPDRGRGGLAPAEENAADAGDGLIAVGVLVGPQLLGGVDLSGTSATVQALAEATLTLVLFCDASRVDLRRLRRGAGVPLRLLGAGLPLTIALGALAAVVVFDRLTFGEALILGVILAPTDAALGQAVVSERRVPSRIRQGINVESGLNDGICVPLLFVAVATADVESHIAAGRGAMPRLAEEVGYGARPRTVAFLGWFGPRGLASIVFALIVVQESALPHQHLIVLAVYLTVGLAAFAHGLSAAPLARRYARWYESHPRDAVPPLESAPAEIGRLRGAATGFGGPLAGHDAPPTGRGDRWRPIPLPGPS